LVTALGIDVLTPDELLSDLVTEYQPQMLAAHRTAVASLQRATDASTVAALQRAGAPATAACELPLHQHLIGGGDAVPKISGKRRPPSCPTSARRPSSPSA